MAELQWPGRPEQPLLRRALRHAIRRQRPELRVIAEDFLAESSKIDLLAVGPGGELVALRIGGEEEETALFVRALADLTWLRPRALDLLKLAPGLGLEASAEPKAIAFCPRFRAETRSAAENLPSCSLELFEYRCLRQQGQLTLLLEDESESPGSVYPGRQVGDRRADRRDAFDQRDDTGSPASHGHQPTPAGEHVALTQGHPLTDPPSPSTFRTGLTEADLRTRPVGQTGTVHARIDHAEEPVAP